MSCYWLETFERQGAVENVLIGLALIAFSVWYFRHLTRRDRAFRKSRFERTNTHGVLEFENYEEARRFEVEEAKIGALYRLGVGVGIAMLVGVVFIIATVGPLFE
ncbi:hypothetical protein DES43_10414 [Aquamicrobium defluvii]|uniref:Uncharacterized protein n=1 Tax=Aquamicrobium defluvii TaxID=69279 RepID=A0A4R6YIJ7_9HYPH|nr:hypothetical protein CF98_19870 [Halopseudomonas bauzanensis]TDR36704.1 hypothetical protein DES43_10414 [Aquamicrobium defluvii]